MAELAADAGITDPPRIAPKRAVTPQEIDQIMADCMTDHGFPAVVKDGGGWGYEVPAGQSDAAALVSYSCKALYPMAAEFVTPLSADQLRVYYDWLVEETIPCMQSLGYPTPEPPTFETYAANYEASQALFFADAALDPAEVGGAMPDILSNCQALPPDDLLYGG
ncbi:hypothetical protein [Ornithinimicrobium murale]|uniref:hypothetical protein n=1 Tax=Ornithinimicrobium murale TaxID=1050153 RepID=UPI0013B3FD1E|nr:hypothetical protein [Ornithinimicrobium murale]